MKKNRSPQRWTRGGFTVACGLLTTLVARGAHAEDSSPEGRSGVTRGYVQAGVVLFDVSGVLADEERARGFGPFGGGTVGIGFVRYLASVPWLGFGAGVRGTFGNSTKGDESYFLNPIFTFATVAAFLPLGPRDSGFELAVDAGFTNILARDDRPGTAGQRLTRHEFGIGPGAGARLGYRLAIPPLSTAVKASIGHSRNWAGVDVNDQPSKTWAMGITSVLVGFEW